VSDDEPPDQQQRGADGRFRPGGRSLNPRGRPPGPAQMRTWFRAYAWHNFCWLQRNAAQGHNLAASNTAIIYTFDQGMGKPTQHIEARVTDLGLQHLLAVAELSGSPILEATAEQEAPFEPGTLDDSFGLFAAAGLPAPLEPKPPVVPDLDQLGIVEDPSDRDK
jgi:hypothetical protein